MADSEPIRILVVDDDPEQRDAVAGMVASKGYVPETAQHGEEALEKLGAVALTQSLRICSCRFSMALSFCEPCWSAVT
jgi:CheY-like chemotaxis protein